MTGIAILALGLIISFSASADKFSYPPQKLSAKGIHQLKISGVRGRLSLKGTSAKQYKIKVTHSKGKRFEDWSLSIDRQHDALVLEVFNVALGAQWRHLVREELWPEFDIEIEGPSQPTVISWREGKMQISSWKSEVEAAFLNGVFEARGMRGSLKLQAVDTQVTVTDHQGDLNLKGEKGRVELAQVSGNSEISWLHGVLRAKDVSGSLQLDWPSGNAQLHGLKGKLKGKGVTSDWDVEAGGTSDVTVVSDSGPVKIRWNEGGAKLFLSSSTGMIDVPKPFSVETREGRKVVEGVKEKNPRGLIFVRTHSGDISWQ